MATGLAIDYFFRGEHAVANGWIRRARNLLEGIEQCPESGWLSIVEAHLALRVEHNPVTAQKISAEAVALGRSLGDVNLEMLALAYEGFALVNQGKVESGMRCLDESTAAAVAGEMSHIHAIATTYCCLIFACEGVRDFHRAAQWCEKLKEFCERWSYRMMFSICRTHYASTLMWRGRWAEAEDELVESTRALEPTRPAPPRPPTGSCGWPNCAAVRGASTKPPCSWNKPIPLLSGCSPDTSLFSDVPPTRSIKTIPRPLPNCAKGSSGPSPMRTGWIERPAWSCSSGPGSRSKTRREQKKP